MKLVCIALTLMALTISHAEPARCQNCLNQYCTKSSDCYIDGCACMRGYAEAAGICVPVR